MGVALLVLVLSFTGARAQTYGLTVPTNLPNLGNVTSAASGDTVFQVAPDGTITKISGNGARTTVGSSSITITISCSQGSATACKNSHIDFTVTPTGSPTNRAKALTYFTVEAGTASIQNVNSTANALTFRVEGFERGQSRTFKLGMRFTIKGDETNATTGLSVASFQVVADPQAGATVTKTGSARATVYRSLSLTKNSDLVFGRLIRPASGSSTVAIHPQLGTRSITGSAVALGTPGTSRAHYTINGEGGRQVSINVPGTVTLDGPGPAEIIITTTKTFSGTPSLHDILGQPGSYSFGVGGSFTLSSSTPVGDYQGSFTVSVNYN